MPVFLPGESHRQRSLPATVHGVLYNLAIELLGIYPKNLITYVFTNTYTQVFTAALFIICRTLNQQRCEWTKNTVVHPDNGIIFSAKKKWTIKP